MTFVRMTIIVTGFVAVANSYGWENTVTHPQLSEYAANKFYEQSFGPEYLKSKAKGRAIIQLIRGGAEHEDDGTELQFLSGKARSLNHFHDPTKAELDDAGLNDLPLFISNGETALLWAQDGGTQINKGWEDWSWHSVRNHYYNQLTASDPVTRDNELADLMTGLGYQMHMIQDLSQPNHVRNDTHTTDGAGSIILGIGFETWAAANRGIIVDKILNEKAIPDVTVDLSVPFSGNSSRSPLSFVSPVARLFDTRVHPVALTPSTSWAQGLAEYTNANFFSQHTSFAAEAFSAGDKHYFPYPKKEESNLQLFIDYYLNTSPVTDVDHANYLSFVISKLNTTGEKLNCLTKPGVNTRFYYQWLGAGRRFYRSFQLDETCFEEYASYLIPRAVAYSQAMLEYFFREEIQLNLPDKGIYAIAAPDGTFQEIRVKAQVTKSGEEMSNGLIKLVIKYAQQDYSSLSAYDQLLPDYKYIVASESNGKTSIPRDTSTELVFRFATNPLPLNATDVSIQVVYKGQFGTEADAVAVGSKDISEPTPVDIVNNMDHVCINGNYMVAGSPEAVAAVDFNGNGFADKEVYPHGLQDVYVAFTSSPVSTSNYSAKFPSIPPGSYGRVFVLGDKEDSVLKVSDSVTVVRLNELDIWNLAFGDTFTNIDAVINQTNYVDGGYVADVSEMGKERGLDTWWYVQYENPEYPDGTSCDDTSAPPSLSRPVEVTIQ